MKKIILPRSNKNRTRFSFSVEITPRKKIKIAGLRFNNKPPRNIIPISPNIERRVTTPIDWGDFPPGSKFEISINDISEYGALRKKFMRYNYGINSKNIKKNGGKRKDKI